MRLVTEVLEISRFMSATVMRKVVPAWLTTFSSIMMLPRSFAPNFKATCPISWPCVTQEL